MAILSKQELERVLRKVRHCQNPSDLLAINNLPPSRNKKGDREGPLEQVLRHSLERKSGELLRAFQPDSVELSWI